MWLPISISLIICVNLHDFEDSNYSIPTILSWCAVKKQLTHPNTLDPMFFLKNNTSSLQYH